MFSRAHSLTRRQLARGMLCVQQLMFATHPRSLTPTAGTERTRPYYSLPSVRLCGADARPYVRTRSLSHSVLLYRSLCPPIPLTAPYAASTGYTWRVSPQHPASPEMEWWSDLVICSLLEHGEVTQHWPFDSPSTSIPIPTSTSTSTRPGHPGPRLSRPGQNHAWILAVPDCSRGPTLDSLIQCGGWSGSPDPYPHLHLH